MVVVVVTADFVVSSKNFVEVTVNQVCTTAPMNQSPNACHHYNLPWHTSHHTQSAKSKIPKTTTNIIV